MLLSLTKTKKMTHLNTFHAKILAYIRKKQYFCKVFLHIAKLGFICLRTAHTALIANEFPLLPYVGWGGIFAHFASAVIQ